MPRSRQSRDPVRRSHPGWRSEPWLSWLVRWSCAGTWGQSARLGTMDVDPPAASGPGSWTGAASPACPTRFAEVAVEPRRHRRIRCCWRELRAGAPEGLVVVADFQTAGRGRFDRSWESPPGKSLLFSVLLRPGDHGSRRPAPPRRRRRVPGPDRRGRGSSPGSRSSSKWPNDLLFGDRKLAGVLAESAAEWGPRGRRRRQRRLAWDLPKP